MILAPLSDISINFGSLGHLDDSWESSFISLCEGAWGQRAVDYKATTAVIAICQNTKKKPFSSFNCLKFNFSAIFERALSVHSNLMLKSGNLGKFLLPNPVVENSPLGEKEILGAVQATVVSIKSYF